jgi:FkbM family methyltransferase
MFFGMGRCAALLLSARAFLAGSASPAEPRGNADVVETPDVSSCVHLRQQSGLSLPHDENVNECDRSRTLPPSCGKFECRFSLYPRARVVVDIGGNIGEDVAGFLRGHPERRVFTYEPTPRYHALLQSKVGDDDRVNISNVGASDSSGDAVFVMAGKHGWSTTGLSPGLEGERVHVQLMDVDEIMRAVQADIGRVPDAVSINCEGCEYAVMQRLLETGWLGRVPMVQLSWHVPRTVKDRVATRCAV